MKIYIVQGSNQVTDSTDSEKWSVTYTETYLLTAHKDEELAYAHILKLREAVSLWCRTLRQPELKEGVRGSIFLQELQDKVGDKNLDTETQYDIITIELKE